MAQKITLKRAVIFLLVVFSVQAAPGPSVNVKPRMQCSDPQSQDQDDMCIWIHPGKPEQSRIIISDKKANLLIVYDLEGKTIQTVPAKHAGNIDVRYDFPLGGKKVDIVALNLRDELKIAVYQVNAENGKIDRIDNRQIQTGQNYGGTLYHSRKTGKFYHIITSDAGTMEQYELSDDGAGKVKGIKVRSWTIGKTEAAVADDETGMLYLAEEKKGIWKLGAEPDAPTPGTLICPLGQNGLTGDMEGIAIYCLPGKEGYLIASNQGSSNFKVYRRAEPHDFLGTFTVQGASDTDGLDVCNINLGPQFPQGLFTCHTGAGRCPVLAVPWEDIAKPMGLKIDTPINIK